MLIIKAFSIFMFKKFGLIKGILAVAILVMVLPNPQALAQPVVSITNDNGNNVSIFVSGATYNQNVDLVYILPNSSLQTVISNIGTAYSGVWNGNLNLSEYGILSGSQVFVRVGGQQSNTITVGSGYIGGCTYPSTGSGPYGNCGSPYGLSLSQNSVTLSVGQSQAVTVNNYGSGFYVSANSNSSVASASVSGNQVNLYGLTNGTTNISICSNSGNYACANIYVTVSGSLGCGYNCSTQMQFSPSSLTLDVGQSSRVTINPNRSYLVQNLYYISSNSNSNVASASILGVGNELIVNALSAGTTNITVCDNQASYNCGTLYITVRNTGTGSGNVWFSPSNPTMQVGQSLAVSINSSVSYSTYSGSSNAYYVASNSNPNVVSASVVGTVLNLYANQTGSSNISVCHSSLSLCSTLYVTVSGSGSSSQLSFSEDFPNLNLNQSRSITVYYNNVATSNFYISSNSNPSIVNATASGNTVNLYGQNVGNSTINICHSTTSVCRSLYTTVGGYSGGNLTFSQNNVNLNYAQNININIYGGSGSGSYYISSNSNPSIVNASISGSTVYLYGQSQGSSTIVVCQNNTASCGTLYVTVYGTGGGSGNGIWFSQSNVNVGQFQNQSVIVYSNLGSNYYISSNSNSNVLTVSVVGNTLNLYGKTLGSSNVVVCHATASNLCGTLFVSVGGGFGGGALSLSQNNLTLSMGQSASITAYNTTGSIYVSSNSNPNVAGASVSNTTLNVYASNTGSTNIVVCQNNASTCATLYVTVDNNYQSGSLSLLTYSLPNITLGQFYNQQLQVSGGTPPYNFTLISGSLPNGFSLSNSGIISGTVNNSVNSSFTIRVNDNFGRSASANFTLTSGSVLGASIYKNGMLIKEGNTIYIVYRNSKTGFANLSAFKGFGFKLANVITALNTGLVSSGYTITTANASHPWGSWIKSGNTVYFVHENGLVPVPDMGVFTNNGGMEANIVPANIKDFTLPILSVMVNDDNRLR
jgi:hypothetical protein